MRARCACELRLGRVCVSGLHGTGWGRGAEVVERARVPCPWPSGGSRVFSACSGVQPHAWLPSFRHIIIIDLHTLGQCPSRAARARTQKNSSRLPRVYRKPRSLSLSLVCSSTSPCPTFARLLLAALVCSCMLLCCSCLLWACSCLHWSAPVRSACSMQIKNGGF